MEEGMCDFWRYYPMGCWLGLVYTRARRQKLPSWCHFFPSQHHRIIRLSRYDLVFNLITAEDNAIILPALCHSVPMGRQ